MGEARLDEGEEAEGGEGEDREDAQGRFAEGVEGGDGVEEDEGCGREEQDAEVVPPGGDVAFDLGGGAGQDVEAEVVVDEEMAEAVEHVEVPGEDGGEEEREG